MPARRAADPAADQPSASISVLEPQGERRRRQLVEIAARVIEQEGVDAVRIPYIAELAGVGRTALYRYFPRREDLLDAVFADFDERLRERVEPAAFAEALRALRTASSDAIPASTERLFGAIWEVLDECGPAGLILRAHASAHEDDAEAAASDASDTNDRFRNEWVAIGFSNIEAALIIDTANALLTRLYRSDRRGLISRAEAQRLGYLAVLGLVRGLSEARRD
ncbi:MAG: helix-turn-helix domain-containing protein [Myxococcota bacterium]